MQLYAFDDQKQLVSVRQAVRGRDYCCMECGTHVRVRGGLHRRDHFYHCDESRICRLNGKSMTHLQIQCYFQDLLPDCQLEHRFDEIGRIADVVWPAEKIIFEIQCSPISAEEVKCRNADYGQLGYQVVWILHDKRFNQKRMSAAEMVLRNKPHYFTNMDPEGVGMIYDQFDLVEGGLRTHKLSELPVLISDISAVDKMPPSISKIIELRKKNFHLCFYGDLVYTFNAGNRADYVQQMISLENLNGEFKKSESWPLKVWKHYMVRLYLNIFHMMLERAFR